MFLIFPFFLISKGFKALANCQNDIFKLWLNYFFLTLLFKTLVFNFYAIKEHNTTNLSLYKCNECSWL